jgi:2-polyprenyl-3-methyl-5-hydroxy-6-metoxy-1,4-benzoquinol methylase
MAAATYDAPLERCPLCGSDTIRRYVTDLVGRRISRCRRCSLQFLNPQYTTEHLDALYGGYMRIGDTPIETLVAEDEVGVEMHRAYLRCVERFVRPGRFLAVGCGNGLEMIVARERGWNIEGFDVDPSNTAQLAAKIAAKVHSGDFVRQDLDGGRFDCVYLHHVLEHPKNPQDYLHRIRDLLTDDGVMFMASPNIASLSNLAKTLQGRLGLRKKKAKHYDAWHHLFYYAPRPLARTLRRYFDLDPLYVACARDHWSHRWSLPMAEYPLLRRVTLLKSKFVLIARRAK